MRRRRRLLKSYAESSDAVQVNYALRVAGVGLTAVLAATGCQSSKLSETGAGTVSPTTSVSSSPSRSASPKPEPPSVGVVVFSDDFRDPASGWAEMTLSSGTAFAYGSTGYVVHARGSLHHLAYAPYAVPHEDVSAAVTALQSTNAPLGAGFGVTCRRGSGRDRVAYEFIVERGSTGGLWYIERRNGIPSTTSPPLVLRKGTADKVPGNTALSLTGACITNRSGHTTRLALFVDDKQLAAIDDVTPGLSADGWSTGIVVASEAAAASTVTVTKFIVRDLQ